MNETGKIVVGAVAIGAVSFGVFSYFLVGGQQRPRQSAEEKVEDKNAAKPEAESKAKETPRATPLQLRRWQLPVDAKPGANPDDRSQFIQNMAFDPTGTRLTAVSQRNAYCFDVASQTVLQSYHGNGIQAAPDGLFLAFFDMGKEEVRIVEASTGKQASLIRASDPRRPEGKALQQAKKIEPRPSNFTVALRRSAIIYQLGIYEVAEFQQPNRKLFKVGIGQNNPERITCITGKAIHWQGDQPLVLSTDESMLLVKARDTIQVCYWQTNQLLLSEVTAGCHAFQNPRFTYDGSHVIVVRHDGYPDLTKFGDVEEYWTPQLDAVDVFDIARRRRTGAFTPPECKPNTLSCAALSHDLKTLAVASGRTISLYNAAAAFPTAHLNPGEPKGREEAAKEKPAPRDR
jgi:hypothetical protein